MTFGKKIPGPEMPNGTLPKFGKPEKADINKEELALTTAMAKLTDVFTNLKGANSRISLEDIAIKEVEGIAPLSSMVIGDIEVLQDFESMLKEELAAISSEESTPRSLKLIVKGVGEARSYHVYMDGEDRRES